MTEAILSDIFDDPRWRQIDRRLYHADIDGEKIGGVVATWNEHYCNFSLNCGEMERLLKAKREGKVNAAFVIAAKQNGTGRYSFHRAVDAETLAARLSNKRVIKGSAGSFWTLHEFELGIYDEPF